MYFYLSQDNALRGAEEGEALGGAEGGTRSSVAGDDSPNSFNKVNGWDRRMERRSE
jgi:hypothetical protein